MIASLPDWVTSDLHFGHKNILKYEPGRPYADTEAMDEGLIQNWNACVQPTDTILVVGDFMLCGMQRCGAIFNRLNGRKYLLMGNHDWKVKPGRWLKIGWVEVLNGTLNLGDNLIANHFPYHGDHTDEERYEKHRPEDTGQVLLHGHVHSVWKTRERMINVGVDVWDCKPVHRDVILKLVREVSDG